MNASPRAVERLAEVRAIAVSGEARRIRQAARLSLADVAGAVGVDYSTVGRWERGERVPRGAAARRYADLIGRLSRCGGGLSPPASQATTSDSGNTLRAVTSNPWCTTTAVTPEALGVDA